MDGEPVSVPADVAGRTVALPKLDAAFTYDRSGPGRLRLDGRMSGRPVTMSLEPVDLNIFTLRKRGFTGSRNIRTSSEAHHRQPVRDLAGPRTR